MANESIPFLGEIVVEQVTRVSYSDSPPMLEVDIVQVENGDTRSCLALRFSERSQFSLLSAIEDILRRRAVKEGDTPKLKPGH